MTGAYRTVIAAHHPLDVAIRESFSRWEIKRGLRHETAADVRLRTLNDWQAEWDVSPHGRPTYGIFRTVQDRMAPSHLRIDHCIAHLLLNYNYYRTLFIPTKVRKNL